MFFTNSYSSHVKRLFVHEIREEIIYLFTKSVKRLFMKSVKRLFFVHDSCHVCLSSLILFSRCFRTCNRNDKKKTKEERGGQWWGIACETGERERVNKK